MNHVTGLFSDPSMSQLYYYMALMRARCNSQQLFVYVYEPATEAGKKKSYFRVTVVTVTPTLQTAK